MNSVIFKVVAALAVIGVFSGIVLWQYSTITKLKADAQTYKIAIEKHEKQEKKDAAHIAVSNTLAQENLDAKGQLLQRVGKIENTVRKAKPQNAQNTQVVDDETRKYIIDELNKPLPLARWMQQ